MISNTRAARYVRFEVADLATHTTRLRIAASTLAFVMAIIPNGSGVEAQPVRQAATQSPAQPTTRQIGTVTAVSADSITLKSDDGKLSAISVPAGVRILQIAPGSTSLKSAEVIALTDISVGDRILVTGPSVNPSTTGPAAAPASLAATRIILMKSIDIAKKHDAEEQAWEKSGTGGIVSAVDPATGTLTITARGKKVSVATSPTTIFRRYAGDSVKFEDAKPSQLAQIQPGDQMRVRGQRTDAETGATIQAVEIVSGSFLNLAGTIATLDPATRTLTIKDLATKKTYTVEVTANSNLRDLPAEDARKFAARERGASAAGGKSASAGNSAPGAHPHPASEATTARPATAADSAQSATPAMSLSQMLPQLPTTTLADLKVGDALMIVASQPAPGSSSLTAVTVLAGVEPILTATPTGQSGPSLSPWNVSGAPDGGGM